MNADQLYCWPRQSVTQNWIAEVAAVLQNLDEGDYQHFIKLSKVISPSERREDRKKAAYEIDSFIRSETAKYKKHDFNCMDKGKSALWWNVIKKLGWIGENIRQIAIGLIIAIVGGLVLAHVWGIGK